MNSILFNTPAPFKLSRDDERLRHIRECLHAENGDEIFAGQINKALYMARVEYLSDAGAILTPTKVLPMSQTLDLTFCVAFTRPQISKRILFEAACFGVKNIIFYAAQKSELAYLKSAVYSPEQVESRLIEGAQQACVCNLPNFYTSQNLQECIHLASSMESGDVSNFRFAPDPYEASSSMANAILKMKSSSTKHHATVIIGGERGFNAQERIMLRESGFELTSLGDKILRTDTATISILTLFSNL